AETHDFALVDRALPVHQDPLGVLLEGRVAQYPENPALVGVIVADVDASPRVVEDPVHELVLLDQLRFSRALRIGLTNTDREQYAPEQVGQRTAHDLRDAAADEHQERQRDGARPEPDPADSLGERMAPRAFRG